MLRTTLYVGVARVRRSDLQGVSPHGVSRYAVADVNDRFLAVDLLLWFQVFWIAWTVSVFKLSRRSTEDVHLRSDFSIIRFSCSANFNNSCLCTSRLPSISYISRRLFLMVGSLIWPLLLDTLPSYLSCCSVWREWLVSLMKSRRGLSGLQSAGIFGDL